MSSLNELFKQLEVDSANDQHEEVLETASEILKTNPHDKRALKLVVVSLINLDRYLKALKVLKTTQAPVDELLLERLYVYYKLNLDRELAEEFERLSDEVLTKNKGLVHLKAQFLYRTGSYVESLELYASLIGSTSQDDPEMLDLSVNERAVLADGFQSGIFNRFVSRSPVSPTSPESYDLLFNESVIQLGLGNLNKSLSLLDSALAKCKEANTDPQEQFEETLPIILQKAYILNLQGKKSDASVILDGISQSSISDELTKLTFINNSIASKIGEDSNWLLTLKELGFPNSINQLSGRLSIVQKAQIWKNYWKLASRVGQRVNSNISVVRDDDYTLQAIASLVKAGVIIDKDTPQEQAKRMTKYALASGDLGASLLAAQLNSDVGKGEVALAVLNNLKLEWKLLPGVSSIILQLCEKTGSEKKKLATFKEIVESYSDASRLDNVKVYDFLKVTALQFVTVEPELSKKLLVTLNNFHKDDLISISLGEASAGLLEPVEHLTQGLDLEDLIQSATADLNKISKNKPTNFKVFKTRKRPMRRPPKNLDTAKHPDPERWLKLSDRSTYKPKAIKGKKNATQGGTADNTTEESISKSSRPSPAPQRKSKKKGRK